MEVACGQCLGCRLDRSRMWAMRIVHESTLHELDEGNCFITLTYRDKWECTPQQLADGLYLPDDWSLHKSHFQKFMKRLRKSRDHKIRYFHAGEYGNRCRHCIHPEATVKDCDTCNIGRPHYHAILFNCMFADLEPIGQENGVVYYTSQQLEDLWKYGHVQVGEVNFHTAAYVARYCLKKVTGPDADNHYMLIDDDGVANWALPEYTTMSRRPGIGRDWYEQFKDDVFPSDEVPVPGKGVIKGVPRYYEQIFQAEAPHAHAEVKRLRESFIAEHGEDYTPERLIDKYKVKKAQIQLLKRGL